jgi:uroporphyrinogen-III synthase
MFQALICPLVLIRPGVLLLLHYALNTLDQTVLIVISQIGERASFPRWRRLNHDRLHVDHSNVDSLDR